MRSSMAFVISGLLFVGLAANFSGSDAHSSDLSPSNGKQQIIAARVEAGDEIAPHRGSGR